MVSFGGGVEHARPERLYIGGGLTTMSTREQPDDARAVAVRGSTIVALGTVEQARAALGTQPRIIDLDGGHIVPGINDSHAHLASWGTSLPPLAADLSYPNVVTIDDALTRVAHQARHTDAGEWVRGGGWSPTTLRECVETPGRMPTRTELDQVAPHTPVVLDDDSLHAYWANSEALRRAGIDADTPDPPGGTIERDCHGVPTGILKEFAAKGLVDRVIPPLTREERKAGIRKAVREFHRLGITSATDPAIGPGGGTGAMGLESLHAYEELARDGELGLRTSLLWLPGEDGTLTAEHVRHALETLRCDTTDERMLRLAGIKVFADGIPPLRTAWLHASYADADTTGSLAVGGDDDAARVAELREIVHLAHAAGLQLGVHATGDASVDATAAAMIAAQQAHPGPSRRHYIIHGDLVSPSTIDRLAAAGIGINTQMELHGYVQEQMARLVGHGRAESQWPCRSLLDAGVGLAFSSDVPAAPSFDWRRGAAAAVLRTSVLTGQVAAPAERITVREALRAYTTAGARQDHAEGWKGSLEPGKVADLCVLSDDPGSVTAEELSELPVTHTVLGGELVHGG